jgi:hypothetical protein
MGDWRGHIDTILDILLSREAPSDENPRCSRCPSAGQTPAPQPSPAPSCPLPPSTTPSPPEKQSPALYRCDDCVGQPLFCASCCKSVHKRTPLHHIKVSNNNLSLLPQTYLPLALEWNVLREGLAVRHRRRGLPWPFWRAVPSCSAPRRKVCGRRHQRDPHRQGLRLSL